MSELIVKTVTTPWVKLCFPRRRLFVATCEAEQLSRAKRPCGLRSLWLPWLGRVERNANADAKPRSDSLKTYDWMIDGLNEWMNEPNGENWIINSFSKQCFLSRESIRHAHIHRDDLCWEVFKITKTVDLWRRLTYNRNTRTQISCQKQQRPHGWGPFAVCRTHDEQERLCQLISWWMQLQLHHPIGDQGSQLSSSILEAGLDKGFLAIHQLLAGVCLAQTVRRLTIALQQVCK